MFTRLVAVLALCLGSAACLAQLTGDYTPGYCFGCPGDENHPDGYDGYPGDHPDNPNAPHGGPGGDGWGSGNGGKGGDGVNGGDGGQGGSSGPDGGCGGDGGDGGDGDPGGHAGNGGQGGDGVDCGGAGGDGGNAPEGTGGNGGQGGNATGEDGEGGAGGDGGDGQFGGNGGCGGNAGGDGGQGGSGGNGGDATGPANGSAGDGGCGGDASGDNGCGGDGGDGGNGGDAGLTPGEGSTGTPGFPGNPGQGPVGDDGDPCWGDAGQPGAWVGPEQEAKMTDDHWGRPGLTLTTLEDDAIDDNPALLLFFSYWKDDPGPSLRWADLDAFDLAAQWPDANGIYDWQGMLHPSSLEAERLRIEVEARDVGPNPLIDADFGFDPAVVTKPSAKKNIGDGWYSQTFTVIRPPEGGPIGPKYDVFTYRARDVEVRVFRVVDLGPLGDVTLDQQVTVDDLLLVGGQSGAAGDLEVEDGDTNMDGVVDSQDVGTVVEDLAAP